MTGLARTVDKFDETMSSGSVSKIDPLVAYTGAGAAKKKYGKKRGVDTTDVGYYEGREKKLAKESDDAAAAAIAAIPKPTPIPGRDTDLERAQRRRRYSRQSSGGRLSTILSDDTLG
jgi:hypothetical protein